MPEIQIYIADRIFTGDQWLDRYALVTSNGSIIDFIPIDNLSSDHLVHHFDKCFLAPAFIDLQIYGADKKLFAVFPGEDTLQRLVAHNLAGGTVSCLPTVATNELSVCRQSIDAIRAYWENKGPGILGLHLEGPWINPVKRGAHIESLVHAPSVNEVKELLEYGKGIIKIITLAPEVCSKEIIELILKAGIIISAGHSNATYQEAMNSFSMGVSLVTHLYNAMSPLNHRQPGLTGAAMDHQHVLASIIPDGHHVDFAALRIAKQAMGARLFAITDAVTETEEGFYPHQRAGDKYESGGILSGSALTMIEAFRNLVNYGNIEIAEALRMCSLYPASAIKMQDELGSFAIGSKPGIIVINNDLELIQIIN